MPLIRPEVIALVAAIATVLVQVLKGPIPEKIRAWIPIILFVLLTAGGVGLAAAYGYDLIAGALEGLFGAATSLGFYAAGSSIPGVKRVVGSSGWIAEKSTDLPPIDDEQGALLTQAYEKGQTEK
jgi:hypothetical protein